MKMPETYLEWATALLDLAEKEEDPVKAIQIALDANECLRAARVLGDDARPD